MSKEKEFCFVKKKKEDREKEVEKKSMVVSLMVFAGIGIISILNDIKKIPIFENFIINALAQWILFMVITCEIIFLVYVGSQLSTKKYKLKEIKK